MFSCVFFSRSLDRQWASCHCPQKWSCRTPWAHILCWGRTWSDSQSSRPRAEMRMPCAFRTGEYGKNVWTGKSRERVVVRRPQKMGETWEGWRRDREQRHSCDKHLFSWTWVMRACDTHEEVRMWLCTRYVQKNVRATGECMYRNDIFMVLWYESSCKEMRPKDIANLRETQLSKCTKSQRHAWMIITSKKKKNGSVGELSTVCSHIVLKCLYMARIGRPHIQWSVNKLARAVTIWTKTCDKSLARFISYIHHTCDYRKHCLCGKHSATLQIRIVSRFWFCRRPWRLKVNFRWNSVYFSEAEHLCQHIGCVRNRHQSHTAQQKLVLLLSCRFRHGWDSRSRSLGFGDWSISFLTEPNQQD